MKTLALLLVLAGGHATAANFTTGTAQAMKHGVHEITLMGAGGAGNPFDARVTVTFTPASGAAKAVAAHGLAVIGVAFMADLLPVGE